MNPTFMSQPANGLLPNEAVLNMYIPSIQHVTYWSVTHTSLVQSPTLVGVFYTPPDPDSAFTEYKACSVKALSGGI